MLDTPRDAVTELREGTARRRHRLGVDVQADEVGHGAGREQPAAGGDEEAAVAARRVEHQHRAPAHTVRHGAGDDDVDEPVGRRVVPALLASASSGLRHGHGASVGSPV